MNIGVHRAVEGKGMACLMGQHIDIIRCAVEVREDKGHMIGGESGAIAAGCLALTGENIEQLAVKHLLDEFLCLGAEILIHRLACR